METNAKGERLKSTEPISPYKYGGGRNDKHQNPDRWDVCRNELTAAKAKLTDIKANPYPHCKKDKQKLKAKVTHLQTELGKRGEVHSMRWKGIR